jgi:hypothetical protein
MVLEECSIWNPVLHLKEADAVTISQFVYEVLLALVPIVAGALVSAIGGALSYLGAHAYASIKARFGQQKADAIAAQTARYREIIEHAATGAVIAVGQSTVDRLKRDGQWNDATAKAVKADAVSKALAAIGEMKDEIGAQMKQDVPSLVELAVETVLKAHKETAATTEAPASTTTNQGAQQ